MISTTELIRVRYAETDQMGHVYYANYLVWFELARTSLFRDSGLTYKQVEELGLKLPVVEAHLQYKDQVRYDDMVEVRATVTEVKRASVRIDYEVQVQGSPKVSTTGYTWHVLVNSDFQVTSFPNWMRRMLEGDVKWRDDLQDDC